MVDPTQNPAGLAIKTEHIDELRTALNQIQAHTYEDSLVKQQTPIGARHFNELREQINALRSGGERYYHLDALGSVRAVTDAAGAVLRRHDYAPFAEEIAPAAGSDARRFTGKERDAETGFDYIGARYYASRTGRFTTVDPGHVSGNIFDPQSWNAYANARNNPLKFIDPTGTEYEVRLGNGTTLYLTNDQFDRLWENPGAGISFENGEVWINNGATRYGSYRYYYGLSDMFRDAGNSAAQRIKEGLTEMAKDTAIAAATFGVGLAARASIGVMLASRSAIVFKTGHYASRLLAAGVNVDRAETAVQGIIRNGGPLHGTIMVDGVRLEYRAMRLTDGRINVGTIFPQR